MGVEGMAQYSLATYTIRIKDKSSNRYVLIDNIGSGTDFLNVMRDYFLNRHMNIAHHQAQKKILKIRKFKPQQYRGFSGIVETGEYGYETELFDTNSGRITLEDISMRLKCYPFIF